MKKHNILWIAWLFPLIIWANLPKDPADYAAWEQKMLSSVEIQKGKPSENAIPNLGQWVSQLSQGANIEGGERPVFHAAQGALLAIPGHANYYRDEIETMRERVTEIASLSQEEQDRLRRERKLVGPGDYNDVRERAFTVLGLLPSHETVAVLGQFLEDPENRAPKNYYNEDWMPYPPNCAAAYIAISNLGIEHPPIQGNKPKPGERQFDIANVDAWKHWWGEVKAGKRTYRFIGSNIEYGADGPANKEDREQDSPRSNERSSGSGKRPQGTSTERSSDTASSFKTLPIAYVLVGFVVVASIAWYIHKFRER